MCLLIISDFIEVPLLTVLELFVIAVWISFVLLIPDRILGSCVWGLLKVLLFVLSAPYCVARRLFVLPRPIDCQSHSLFCRCRGCRTPEEEMQRLWQSSEGQNGDLSRRKLSYFIRVRNSSSQKRRAGCASRQPRLGVEHEPHTKMKSHYL